MKELRGHHIFCTTLFSGSGYDQAFTTNMRQLIEYMQNGGKFQLVQGHDAICQYCPNREPDGCALGTENVAHRDTAALEVTGLATGQVMDWTELREYLGGISEEGFQHVCSDCRWQKEGLCTYKLLRERVSG